MDDPTGATWEGGGGWTPSCGVHAPDLLHREWVQHFHTLVNSSELNAPRHVGQGKRRE